MEIQDRSRNKTDKNYDEKNLEVEHVHFQLFGEGKVATPTTDGILTFINKRYEDAFV